MNRGYTGGKRQREAAKERKKKEKEERLRRNRELRAQGIDPDAQEVDPAELEANRLPEVKLEDIVIGVAPRPKQKTVGPTKLFVGGLSWETTGEDLRQAFSKFGNVTEATVIADRGTGRSRGFGFVSYESPAEAAEAAKQMDGAELDGRTLRVNPAEGR
jgi:RNA recognition motif-containing protein